MRPTDNSSFGVFINFDYLSNIKIDNEDIMECYFIEDIYSMSMLGKITLYDKYGIKEYGPLTGDERIIVTYGSDGIIEKEFGIYRIPKIEGITEFKKAAKSAIEIYFADTFFNNLTMKKFSKSWGIDMSGSDIVADMIDDMLELDMNTVDLEPSDGNLGINFYVPFWNTADSIRWISNRITGTRGKYGYMLFSNSKNLLNYVTLDGMLKLAEKDPDIYIFDTSNINYENTIMAWQASGVDHIGVKEIGGGQVLGFDTSSKTFLGIEKDEEFIYSKAINKITSLGNASLFDGNYIDNDNSKFNYMYKVDGDSDKKVLKNIFYNDFIRRYSLHNTVKLMLLGHDKRYAGQKIEIMWPSANRKEIYNALDSGEYLIKSITHQFSPLTTPLYTQTIVLIKNAYNSSKIIGNTKTAGYTPFNLNLGKFST